MRCAVSIFLGCLLLAGGVEARNLEPGVSTPQDAINAGEVDATTLFYRGLHLFSNSFTMEDHYGEGPDGPRQGAAADLPGALPYIRINGLDAQSCMECHSRMGMRAMDGLEMPREPGTVGGSGGIASNVISLEGTEALEEAFVRNPPHLFGSGYVERLAQEMSEDLQTIRHNAIFDSVATGEPVRRELISKGVSFGYLTASPIGSVDLSELDGVSIDLVVRPFQFKGIASSVRNFVVGALNFHFSVQPREALVRHLIEDDGDAVREEILEGDVTAMTFFVSALRPPMSDTRGLDADTVERGRMLFETIGCAECHVPSLRMNYGPIFLFDPRATEPAEKRDWGGDYVSIQKARRELGPTMSLVVDRPEDLAPMREHAREGKGLRYPGWYYDLSDRTLPDEALPRLDRNEDGSVDVPLYSDLRRHRMGEQLADVRDQVTDVLSLRVRRDEFLTRPLWGVADTGPWMHDGRALSLEEAIRLHGGEGSEAATAAAAFESLAEEDRAAVVTFLKSLRVRPLGHMPEPGVRHRTGMVVR